MRRGIFLFLVVLIGSFDSITAHPVHISVINLDIVSDSGILRYSVRVFYDDFEALINHLYNTQMDLSNQNRLTFKEQNSIKTYINSTFEIKDNTDKTIHPEFTGWKREDASLWLFFCAPVSQDGLEKLTIDNKIMLELFEDQKNFLIIQADSKEKGFEFNHRMTCKSIVCSDLSMNP